MSIHTEAEITISRPRSEVFDFLSRAPGHWLETEDGPIGR